MPDRSIVLWPVKSEQQVNRQGTHSAEGKHNLSVAKLIKFLKLYLSMEAWFHCNNPKTKVRSARPLIADVIRTMTNMFPRDGQGWHISKVRGLTKMQHYIVQFGSGINFHGGRGEANHKWLVKDTGNNTQPGLALIRLDGSGIIG